MPYLPLTMVVFSMPAYSMTQTVCKQSSWVTNWMVSAWLMLQKTILFGGNEGDRAVRCYRQLRKEYWTFLTSHAYKTGEKGTVCHKRDLPSFPDHIRALQPACNSTTQHMTWHL